MRSGREAGHLRPCAGEVKNTWTYTATPPYIFRESFIYPLKKKLAALSMLHKAQKAYYACDVIRFLVPYAARNRLAVRTGCAVHAPCLLAVRQLP